MRQKDGLPDAWASLGTIARDKLEKQIAKRWSGLSESDREALGANNPSEVVTSILGLARLAGTPSRMEMPRGPGEEPRAVEWRPLDKREDALRSGTRLFTVPELRALKAAGEKLRTDLDRLCLTQLVRRNLLSPSEEMRRKTIEIGQALLWCTATFLPSVLAEAKGATKRRQADSRRIVVKLLNYVKSATGSYRYTLVAHLLNWRAPRESGEWDTRLLRRWLRDADSLLRSRTT